MNDLYYLYVYLDPRKPGLYQYNNIEFDHEPIYVGKGKNNRYKHHIKDAFNPNSKNSLKSNKLKKIIKEVSLTKKEYTNKYIIKIYESTNEEKILDLEKEYIETIGTINEVYGVLKRGPLTNLIPGGLTNPVFCGSQNPMFGKSIYYVWLDKYEINEALIKIKDHKNAMSKMLIDKWNSYTQKEKDEVVSRLNKNRQSGDDHYRRKLTDKELINYEKKRLKAWKRTVKNRDPEYDDFLRNQSKARAKEFWKNLSKEDLIKIKNKISKSLQKYYKEEYTPEKRELRSKNIIAAKLKFKTQNPEKYKRWIDALSGKNHYLHKYTNLYEYLEEKHGKEYSELVKKKNKKRLAGKNNPMYGKGEKIKGGKNGRAVNYIIHFPKEYENRKVLCVGTFKKFSEEVLSKIKPMPHRKYPRDGITRNGWMFKKIKNLDEIKIKEYERFK